MRAWGFKIVFSVRTQVPNLENTFVNPKSQCPVERNLDDKMHVFCGPGERPCGKPHQIDPFGIDSGRNGSMPGRAKTALFEDPNISFQPDFIWKTVRSALTLRPGQRRGSGSYTAVFGGAGMSRNEEKKHYFLRKKLKNNVFFIHESTNSC